METTQPNFPRYDKLYRDDSTFGNNKGIRFEIWYNYYTEYLKIADFSSANRILLRRTPPKRSRGEPMVRRLKALFLNNAAARLSVQRFNENHQVNPFKTKTRAESDAEQEDQQILLSAVQDPASFIRDPDLSECNIDKLFI